MSSYLPREAMQSMSRIRPAAVSGSFYPAGQAALEQLVDHLLAAVPAATSGSAPKALIVPHAGYRYSGPVAASAYALLRPLTGAIRRVVLLGPTHRVAVRGLAMPGAQRFATPLGTVDVDQDAAAAIRQLPQVTTDDLAHAGEHSIEVQLPFLQRTLKQFRLLPLAVGDATAGEVAEVLEILWGGPETLLVVSTDLSHYLAYEAACAADRNTVAAILALDEERIGDDDACGSVPVRGLVRAARTRGLHARLLDLRNSGDTAGDRTQVVGYAALAFAGPDHA